MTSQKPCKVCPNGKMTSQKCCKVCKNAKSIVTTMVSQRFWASQKSKNTRQFANFILRLPPLSTHMDLGSQKRDTYATFFWHCTHYGLAAILFRPNRFPIRSWARWAMRTMRGMQDFWNHNLPIKPLMTCPWLKQTPSNYILYIIYYILYIIFDIIFYIT